VDVGHTASRVIEHALARARERAKNVRLDSEFLRWTTNLDVVAGGRAFSHSGPFLLSRRTNS